MFTFAVPLNKIFFKCSHKQTEYIDSIYNFKLIFKFIVKLYAL